MWKGSLMSWIPRARALQQTLSSPTTHCRSPWLAWLAWLPGSLESLPESMPPQLRCGLWVNTPDPHSWGGAGSETTDPAAGSPAGTTAHPPASAFLLLTSPQQARFLDQLPEWYQPSNPCGKPAALDIVNHQRVPLRCAPDPCLEAAEPFLAAASDLETEKDGEGTDCSEVPCFLLQNPTCTWAR